MMTTQRKNVKLKKIEEFYIDTAAECNRHTANQTDRQTEGARKIEDRERERNEKKKQNYVKGRHGMSVNAHALASRQGTAGSSDGLGHADTRPSRGAGP